MRSLLFSILTSLLLLPAGAEQTISLAHSAAAIRARNPELAAARIRIAEAEGRLLGSGRLSNPELSLGLVSDRQSREGAVSIALDQRFPLTARLRLAKGLSRQLVSAAALEVQEQERLLIAKAQAHIVRLLALEQQRALRSRQATLAQELTRFTRGRAAEGELPELDALQAEVEQERLALDAQKLENERIALLGRLKPMLGLLPDTPLRVIGELPLPRLPAKSAGEQRPDYQLAITKEATARTELDLAKARRWDDITAGLVWESEREEAPRGLERSHFLGGRLTIPLPLWERNQGEIAEKKASRTRAHLETKALATGISNEIATARAEMEALARLAKATTLRLLPLAKTQEEKLKEAYDLGQSELLSLLRAREQRLQLESEGVDALREFHLARIRYEAATAQHTSPSNRAK